MVHRLINDLTLYVTYDSFGLSIGFNYRVSGVQKGQNLNNVTYEMFPN